MEIPESAPVLDTLLRLTAASGASSASLEGILEDALIRGEPSFRVRVEVNPKFMRGCRKLPWTSRYVRIKSVTCVLVTEGKPGRQ